MNVTNASNCLCLKKKKEIHNDINDKTKRKISLKNSFMSAQRLKNEPLFISFSPLFLIIFILKKPDVLVDVLMTYVHSYCHALICA